MTTGRGRGRPHRAPARRPHRAIGAWGAGPAVRRLVWPAAVVRRPRCWPPRSAAHRRPRPRPAARTARPSWPVTVGIARRGRRRRRRPRRASARRSARPPALRRAPSEIARRIAESAAQRLPTGRAAATGRRGAWARLDSPRVEIWLAPRRGARPARSDARRATDSPALHRRRSRGRPRSAWPARGGPGAGCRSASSPRLGGARRAPLRIAAITDSGELLGLVVIGPPARRRALRACRGRGTSARRVPDARRDRCATAPLTVALEASLADLQRTNTSCRRPGPASSPPPTPNVAASNATCTTARSSTCSRSQSRVGLLKQMVAKGEPPEEIESVVVQLGDDVRSGGRTDPRTGAGHLSGAAHGQRARAGAAQRCRAYPDPASVRVADGLRRYPANLEAAVYFCCIEAVQNVGEARARSRRRHRLVEQATASCTATCATRARVSTPTQPTAGMGRTTMADRVGALGGAVRWESRPGEGTAVIVEVPCRWTRVARAWASAWSAVGRSPGTTGVRAGVLSSCSGVAGGVVAGPALAIATVLWRTDTAYDRLVSATNLDDVRVSIMTSTGIPSERPAILAQERAAGATLAAATRRYAARWSSPSRSARIRGPGVVYTISITSLRAAAPTGRSPNPS